MHSQTPVMEGRQRHTLSAMQVAAGKLLLHVEGIGARGEAELADGRLLATMAEFGAVASAHAVYGKDRALVRFAEPEGTAAALRAAEELRRQHGLGVSAVDLHRALLSAGIVGNIVRAVADELGRMHERLDYHHDELERAHSSLKYVRVPEYVPPRYTAKHEIWARFIQAHFRGWRARRWAKIMHLREGGFPTMALADRLLSSQEEADSLQAEIAAFAAPELEEVDSLASIEWDDLFSDEEEEEGVEGAEEGGGAGAPPVVTLGLDFSAESNHLGPQSVRTLVRSLEDQDGPCTAMLMSLDLSGNDITGSVGHLPAELDTDLSGLRALVASKNFAGLGMEMHGRPATPLGTLCLADTGLGYAGLEVLLECVGRSLGALDLSYNRFGDHGCARLVELLCGSQALEKLRLSGNQLGPTAAKALGRLLSAEKSRLRCLDLSENFLAGVESPEGSGPSAVEGGKGQELAGLKALGDGLRECGRVNEIDLSRNSLGAAAAAALAPGLVAVRRLNLAHNLLGDAGVEALAPHLKGCRLRVLDLQHNWLYWRAASTLASALASATELEDLELSSNLLGGHTMDSDPQGIAELAPTLRRLAVHGSLRRLGLASCRIGARAAEELACAFSKPPTEDGPSEDQQEQEEERAASALTELNLSNNLLLSTAWGDSSHLAGWRTLATHLGRSSITDCALVDCGLGPTAALVMADSMREWTSLHTLDLSENPLGDAGVSALSGRLKVQVVQARGISPQTQGYNADGTRSGFANCAVVMRCGGKTHRTRTIYHTLSPRWELEDAIEFDGLGESADVELSVVHWEEESDGEPTELGCLALKGIGPDAGGEGDGPLWYPFFARHQAAAAAEAVGGQFRGMISDPDGRPGTPLGPRPAFEVQLVVAYIPSSLAACRGTALHTLRLCGCSLRAEGARALAAAVSPTLRRLELDDNRLSNSELAPTEDATAGPRQWQLDADITGVVRLARRLREMQEETGVLLQLSVENNRLGPGAQAAVGSFARAAKLAVATPRATWGRRRGRGGGAKAVALLSAAQSNVWADVTRNSAAGSERGSPLGAGS